MNRRCRYCQIERIENRNPVSSEKHLIIRHMIKTAAQESKRKDIAESEVVLAFPVTETSEPNIQKQEVHAFLPAQGLRF